jgi:hypothetical protein
LLSFFFLKSFSLIFSAKDVPAKETTLSSPLLKTRRRGKLIRAVYHSSFMPFVYISKCIAVYEHLRLSCSLSPWILLMNLWIIDLAFVQAFVHEICHRLPLGKMCGNELLPLHFLRIVYVFLQQPKNPFCTFIGKKQNTTWMPCFVKLCSTYPTYFLCVLLLDLLLARLGL